MESDIPLFALADRRLAWIEQRSALLARNVANADTPRYRPTDLPPFETSLAESGFSVTPARTDPAHLAGTATPEATRLVAGEQAPDGNAVSLDEQLRRIADTDTTHELVGQIYMKYLGMFRTALGR